MLQATFALVGVGSTAGGGGGGGGGGGATALDDGSGVGLPAQLKLMVGGRVVQPQGFCAFMIA